MATLWKLGLVALVALVLTALPNGDDALSFVLALLSIAFFTAIAVLGYRLFLQYRSELDGLPDGDRAVLYGAVGLAFLTFCATNRLFDVGGGGAIVWLALLGLCSYAIYRVWTRYRAYG